MKTLLVRPPSASLSDGQTTYIDRVPINVTLAQKQWQAYVDSMSSEGWTIVSVERADDAPDSVFVEDTLIIFGRLAVLASPGLASRFSEIRGAQATVNNLGLETCRIKAPGTLDGGDVLKIGKTVYVGRSDRTNAEGIRQLRAIISPLGYTVVAVPVTKALHLKSAVTALPDGTVIGYEPIVDSTSIFPRFLPVPEVYGVAVVVLNDHSVLMSANAPKTAKMIGDLVSRTNKFSPSRISLTHSNHICGLVTDRDIT